jgi:hypothetical protein
MGLEVFFPDSSNRQSALCLYQPPPMRLDCCGGRNIVRIFFESLS